MTEPINSVRSLPFRIEREGGIGELVIDQPPVNALDARGWQLLADAIDAAWVRLGSLTRYQSMNVPLTASTIAGSATRPGKNRRVRR